MKRNECMPGLVPRATVLPASAVRCCTPHLLFVMFLSQLSGHRDKAAGSKKTFVSTFSADYLHCLVS